MSPARTAYFGAKISALVLSIGLLLGACVNASGPTGPFPDPPASAADPSVGPQTAVLAGGCFWGMEGVFERIKGVTNVVSGYSGGQADTAHYEMVSTGTTGHAESVEITFDPSRVSYGTLLKVYFSIAHDPTELNFQGPDEGTQYRSAIFYANDAQRRLANAYIKELTLDKTFSKPIVTQVVPLVAFYPAEDYHQHFLDLHEDNPYIAFWDLPKIKNLENTYPDLVVKG